MKDLRSRRKFHWHKIPLVYWHKNWRAWFFSQESLGALPLTLVEWQLIGDYYEKKIRFRACRPDSFHSRLIVKIYKRNDSFKKSKMSSWKHLKSLAKVYLKPSYRRKTIIYLVVLQKWYLGWLTFMMTWVCFFQS